MDKAASSAKSTSDYEAELRAANEVVYKHSLELARLGQELKRANEQQESLLHFISHEVKGYLSKSEAGFASIIEGDYGVISGELKKMATDALSEIRVGVRTVTEILNASNLKKGTMGYEKKSFDFKPVVLSVVDNQKHSAEEKNLKIITSVGDAVYMLHGDEDKIKEHLVRNLVDNAIKYTSSGDINVNLSRNGNILRLTVEDMGVGITQDDMARLFTEGGHGKDSTKTNVHSTGYGLFIAKTITEAHGGKIWAESEGAGKGSRFIVELPVA